MFTSIGMDNFESEISLEMKPVLLACIRRGFEAKEQLKVLETVSRKMAQSVKICLLYDGPNDVYRELSVAGTPTFLIYLGGEEVARVLGKVSPETLVEFVVDKLSQEMTELEQLVNPLSSS